MVEVVVVVEAVVMVVVVISHLVLFTNFCFTYPTGYYPRHNDTSPQHIVRSNLDPHLSKVIVNTLKDIFALQVFTR